MSILNYVRTRSWLVSQCMELGGLLAEAREECVAAVDRCNRLTEQLAQAVRERDRAWRTLAAEQARPAPAPLPSTDAGLRAELRKERDRANDLEVQLDKLQRANMAADIPF